MAAVATLRVATCQYAVSANVMDNARTIVRQAKLAKTRGADVVHFPEGALSGYAGSDFASFDAQAG